MSSKERRESIERVRRATVDLSKAIMDFSPAAIVIIDQAGVIQLANPKAEQLFGLSASDMSGKPLKSLFPRRYRSHYESFLRRSLQQNESELELLVIRQDGKRIPVGLLIGRMLLNGDHYYLLFFTICGAGKARKKK